MTHSKPVVPRCRTVTCSFRTTDGFRFVNSGSPPLVHVIGTSQIVGIADIPVLRLKRALKFNDTIVKFSEHDSVFLKNPLL